jgi:phenylalanine N-monooxygenase
MIRRLMFGKRHFFAAATTADSGAGNNGSRPGPEEVAHVDALFTLLNYLYSFSVSDYIPAAAGCSCVGCCPQP